MLLLVGGRIMIAFFCRLIPLDDNLGVIRHGYCSIQICLSVICFLLSRHEYYLVFSRP